MDLPELSADHHMKSETGYLQQIYRFLDRNNLFDLLVIVICLASFCCSWIEAMINPDNMHWGWAYLAALDLKRGAIPHSEIIIFYGYIYTWIQSVSLMLFGERLMSVGIITGIFYSASLFLSYRIFLRFMKKGLAVVSVLLIFLIHPYIIYPLANYFAYTFQLLALIFFLYHSKHHYHYFLAGFFLCMSVLCRYSSIIAILPPFLILLCWDFYIAKESRKNVKAQAGYLSAGFFIPLILFFTYLSINSALDDFFYQNKMLVTIIGNGDSIGTYLYFLASVFQFVPSLASDFRGKLFTLILAICLFIMIRAGIRKWKGENFDDAYNHYDLMAVCIITIFGYLNSVHVYETFRLVNGASLGVGLCVFVFHDYFIQTSKPLKYAMIILSVSLTIFLSSTLFFKTTTSSYYPWKPGILMRSGVKNETIGLFKGKIMTKEYSDFYQEVYDAIAPFKNNCVIINYTRDCIALIVNDLPRIQIAPVHFPWLDDVSKQAKYIDGHGAVILSYKVMELPGYENIFKKNWPGEIPWLRGGCLFIYAPQRFVSEK